MALCVVSGNVYLPNGELAVARAMVFRRSDRAIKADYLGVVLPDDVHDKTNREGFIEVALITGVYEVYARGNSDYYMGRAVVPEAATAAFSDIFTAASPVPPLPEWLLQVEEARAAAELAADEAEAAAESVAGMQGDIDQAVADSQEALGAVDVLSSPPNRPFDSRDDAEAAEVPAEFNTIQVGGLSYDRDPNGTALETADGGTWRPSGLPASTHFGLAPASVDDDTDAIIRTINAGGEFLPGTYRLTAPISVLPRTLKGDQRGGTRFRIDNLSAETAISITASEGYGDVIGAQNIEFVITGSDVGAVIRTPKNSANYFTNYTRVLFRGLSFRGDERNTGAHGFTWNHGATDGFIVVGDCQGCEISDIVGMGNFNIAADPAGQTVSKGIVLDAAGGILSARMSNIELGSLHTAVEIKDRVFYSLDAYDIMSCYDGLIESGAVMPFSEPKIGKGNVNAQRTGIKLAGTNARDVSNVTIRRHGNGWTGASHTWVGIDATDLQESNIRNCHIEQSPGFGANERIGIRLANGGGVKCIGNTFGDNLDICYDLSNVAGFDLNGDYLHTQAVINYLRARNNTRYGKVVSGKRPGQAAYTANVTWFTDDGTVNWSTIWDDVRGFERLAPREAHTIAAGVISPKSSWLQVDTEASAAADDLDTITPPIAGMGAMIYINCAASARAVTLKNRTGNLLLPADVALNHPADVAVLMWAGSSWILVSQANNG